MRRTPRSEQRLELGNAERRFISRAEWRARQPCCLQRQDYARLMA